MFYYYKRIINTFKPSLISRFPAVKLGHWYLCWLFLTFAKRKFVPLNKKIKVVYYIHVGVSIEFYQILLKFEYIFTKLCWNIICNKNKSILSINLYHCKNSINLTNCSVKFLRLSYIFRGRSKIFVEITLKHLFIGLGVSLKKKEIYLCHARGPVWILFIFSRC